LLFKLSLAPAHDRFAVLERENAPVPGQDYEHVPLTYAQKLPAVRFAKALLRATLTHEGSAVPPSAERLLASGDLDSRDDADDDGPQAVHAHRNSPYAVGSTLWNTFHALEQRDDSFKTYLARNEIDLARLDDLTPSQRASRLRKVRNLVVVREHFRGDDGKRRSRKSFALYAGADSILSLPDGNPRMIIALVRQLFPVIEAGTQPKRVAKAAQGHAIDATLQRFLALLEAQEAVKIDGQAAGVMDLLDYIGKALAVRLVEDPFTDNVRLTLRIPAEVRPEVRTLLTRSINAGALIHVPVRQSDGRLPADLTNHQFRLSNLLACLYGLPIHLTPPAPLEDLLPLKWQAGRLKPVPRSRSQRALLSPPQVQGELEVGDEK